MNTVFTGMDVGTAVRKLFATAPEAARRVVITAYVSNDPVPLLGRVEDLEVYCSPSPTGTSAVGVSRLLAEKAQVFFSKGLHMKVYWVEGHGALVGSANLSENGLAGGLAEVLVGVPAESISIPELIAAFKHPPKLATTSAIEKLKRGNDKAGKGGRNIGESASDQQKNHGRQTKFPEWYTRMTVPPVKLGWYTEERDSHPHVDAAARLAGFVNGVADFNGAASESTYAKGDWILMLRLRKGLKEIGAETPSWLHVDDVTKLTVKEAKRAKIEGHPWVAWQGAEVRQATPFSVSGTRVQKALRAAWAEHAKAWLNEDGLIDEEKLAAPPLEFFASVLAHYNGNKVK